MVLTLLGSKEPSVMKAKSGAGKSSLCGSETKTGIHVIICSEERETQMVWEKWFWKIITHSQL